VCKCWISLKSQHSCKPPSPKGPSALPPILYLLTSPKHDHVQVDDQKNSLSLVSSPVLLLPIWDSIRPPLPLLLPFPVSALLIGATDCARHLHGAGPYPWHSDPVALRPPGARHPVPRSTIRKASNRRPALPAARASFALARNTKCDAVCSSVPAVTGREEHVGRYDAVLAHG